MYTSILFFVLFVWTRFFSVFSERLLAFVDKEGENLTRQFQEQTSRYVAYLHDRPSMFVESMVLRDLPPALRSEVLETAVGRIVRGLPFWRDLNVDREFFDDILASLRPRHYLPSDLIVYQGEYGRSMFFLCSGKAHVTVQTVPEPVARLVAGQYFGETALLSSVHLRTANVVSTSYCDCFVLSREDFRSTVTRHNVNRIELETSILNTLRTKSQSNNKKVASVASMNKMKKIKMEEKKKIKKRGGE